MKTQSTIGLTRFLFAVIGVMGMVAAVITAQAVPTFWSGPNTNFSQTAFSSPPKADVLLPGKVSLTRNVSHWLYNTNVDVFGAAPGTPSDTEWAFGALTNWNHLTYRSFDSFRNGDLSGVLVTIPPSPMVCHLINEDIYLSVTFTSWPQGGGLISYTRSTPAAVLPSPTVSITNPAPNTVFSAPANVKISATATVSGGTVTNVSFFGNNSLLGSKQSSPFTITANALAAGAYNLTAVATAGGISSTSAVVAISVVAPVATSLSGSTAVNNQFSFSYATTPGLKYVVEGSSNLVNWTPLVTNVATGNPSVFTNTISAGDDYFRVGRLPNP